MYFIQESDSREHYKCIAQEERIKPPDPLVKDNDSDPSTQRQKLPCQAALEAGRVWTQFLVLRTQGSRMIARLDMHQEQTR